MTAVELFPGNLVNLEVITHSYLLIKIDGGHFLFTEERFCLRYMSTN